MFNVESLHDVLKSTIPPITQEEYHYFDNFMLVKKYEESDTPNYIYAPTKDEPEIQFHEFIFILGRIADTTVNITDQQDAPIKEKLEILLIEKLKFKKIEDHESYVDRIYGADQLGGEDDSYEESDESEEEYIGIDDPQRVLQDFLA